MKNGNYNKMGKIVKKKIARFWIFRRKASPSGDIRYSTVRRPQAEIFICAVIMLFITLLLKLPPREVGVASNPPKGADNTQTLHFSTPAAGLPPAGLQVDSNQFVRAAGKIPRKGTTKAGGLALWKDAVNRPPKFYDWLDELIEKIWQVESSGRLNPPDGDGGRAAGPLQIHQCVLDDVNKRYGTKFCREDLRNLKTAKLVARLYISRWIEKHKEEIAARTFNGGPRGWRKKSTDSYWEKIRSQKPEVKGDNERRTSNAER